MEAVGGGFGFYSIDSAVHKLSPSDACMGFNSAYFSLFLRGHRYTLNGPLRFVVFGKYLVLQLSRGS